jgi:hypothetical protein
MNARTERARSHNIRISGEGAHRDDAGRVLLGSGV